ncbi:formylglycine-generating enzyme family protein [Arthrobacter sp. SDTb3-6]|uniref:formylglycine-generating enzyme family protein n=1 Tax=Arthrobacter sp. SDTb3-6 TaxID=2713571 RepID=UPI00159D3CDB|nr:formylglycine-generating enzyme family protein [Arthrobacter sp. SDTb3-6]
MGSDSAYPEEAPSRHRSVGSFHLERHPVTNAQFARFVEATDYVTEAERKPEPANYPGVDPRLLTPGALVFTPTPGPVPLDDWRQWWRVVPGACWHRPEGPGSSIAKRMDHPVVQVSFEDAAGYARWSGRRLPTEVELEYAMRADHPATTYAWGEEERPNGQLMANTWQGRFPYLNTGAEGWVGTSPIGSFPANRLGLVDLIGNVWEWTSTLFAEGSDREVADRLSGAGKASAHGNPYHAAVGETLRPQACCCLEDPKRRMKRLSTPPGESTARRVVKGGSHLCSADYCHRYRPAARQAQSEDSASTHIGFRCAV